MLITGAILNGLGSVALAIGTVAYVANDSVVCVFEGPGGGGVDPCSPHHGADTAVMVIGGIATLAGIPLIVIGAQTVNVKREAPATPAPATISLSPGGASLKIAF